MCIHVKNWANNNRLPWEWCQMEGKPSLYTLTLFLKTYAHYFFILNTSYKYFFFYFDPLQSIVTIKNISWKVWEVFRTLVSPVQTASSSVFPSKVSCLWQSVCRPDWGPRGRTLLCVCVHGRPAASQVSVEWMNKVDIKEEGKGVLSFCTMPPGHTLGHIFK